MEHAINYKALIDRMLCVAVFNLFDQFLQFIYGDLLFLDESRDCAEIRIVEVAAYDSCEGPSCVVLASNDRVVLI